MRNWKYTLVYVPCVNYLAPFILAKMDYLNGPDNFIEATPLTAEEIGQELGGN